MEIWFSSDWHLGHKNIVQGCTEWKDWSQCRDFRSLKEHDEYILHKINSHIKYEDILYFMGDFSLGGEDNIWRFRNRIECDTIHFIGGNHDHFVRRNKVLTTDHGMVNARNLFSSYNELLEKEIGKQTVIMCHYAMATWHKAKKGSWMLHGHSHGNLKPTVYKKMDVGIDCHPDFRPFHLDEVKKYMSDKENLDHHEREETAP